MELKFMDAVTSTMRSVNNALASMCQVAVDDQAHTEQEKITAFTVIAPDDCYSTVVEFSQENAASPCKGAVAVYVPKESALSLFEKTLKFTEKTPPSEFADACGELCNLIMGGLKLEWARLGYGEVEMGLPRTYTSAVFETLSLKAKTKYSISFSSKGSGLLAVHMGLGT